MNGHEFNIVANASHRPFDFRLHPLGFFYFQKKITSRMSHHVHVWLQETFDEMRNDTHSHSYTIESAVLAGKIRNDLFRYEEDSEGKVLEFEVMYEAGKSIVRCTGKRGNLEQTASSDTSKGKRYHLEAGTIHRVTVEEFPCVTVLTTIEQGIPICSYGLVDDEKPFARRLARPQEVRKIGRVLADALRFKNQHPETP